jgi:hypothetical protein
MDGGAEVYLDFRFKRLEVKEYKGPEKATLTVEIYEFDDSQDAYGIFSRDTTGEIVELGQGGRTSRTQARFWKGNCYISVYTWQTRPDLEGLAFIYAQATAENIESSALPNWLHKLLAAGMNPLFVRSVEALERLTDISWPASIAINENSGAAWISPLTSNSYGGVVLVYPNDMMAVEIFKGLWQDIAAQAKGSARSETRGMAALNDTLAQGVQRVGFNVIWVPAAKNEIACAATLDILARALRGE